MNLVIDCFKLVKGAGKSIGIYNLAKSVTEHLGERALALEEEKPSAKRKDGKASHTVIVFGNAHNRPEFDVPGVTFVEMKGNPLNKIYCVLWELFLVKKYAKRYQADRVLFPRGYRPIGRKGSLGRCKGGRKIKDTVIIHDLIPFYYDKHYPGFFHKMENAYIMYRLKVSMRKADSIITISEYSKEDIMDKVPGCGRKIKVIHNGMNDVSFEPEQDKGYVPGGAPKKEKQEYIVAMTSGLPHKNARGVLRAYEAYRRKADRPLDLRVIGIEDTSFYKEMDAEAASHVKCDKFFQAFDEMCRVISGAKAYLFLSYMEGFGFPPLEAMQLGVPVVCSDRASLPEVVADAGVLVDPDDLEGVVLALLKVTEQEEFRKELIEKGYGNIGRFSWESRTDLYWKELMNG
ncbi:MAG: glycosyltransferase family 1 protein [Kineothrix sp.]|nr:glycosyltransferase family 1 protein [Kineothrix sp.]